MMFVMQDTAQYGR